MDYCCRSGRLRLQVDKLWTIPRQWDMADTGVSPSCSWQNSMVTKSMGMENMTHSNKDLAQKEVICVLKWSQCTVMQIPEQTNKSHSRKEAGTRPGFQLKSFGIQGLKMKDGINQNKAQPKHYWLIRCTCYQCRNSSKDGRVNVWNIPWWRHLD